MTNPTPGPADWTPDHYRGAGMQPFDVIDAFNLDFYEGNVLKYLLRWRRKNGVEDLCKARTYLQVLIDQQPTPEAAADPEYDALKAAYLNAVATGAHRVTVLEPDPAADAHAVVQAVTRAQLHDAIRTLARMDRPWWDGELRRMARLEGRTSFLGGRR